MKKILSLLSVLCLTVSLSFANEPLSIDQNQIDADLKSLDKIEAYVNANPGTTLAEVKLQNPNLVEGVNIAESASVSIASGELPGNIPPFIWGCVLSWVGLILVYVLSDKDSAMTKKALIGCLVQAAVWVVYYFVVLGAVFGAAKKVI